MFVINSRIVAAAAAVMAVAAAALPAVASTPSKAKPVKKVCNLLVDPSGDAQAAPGTPLPSDDSLDILSGDVASTAKTLTAAIRMKSLTASDPQAPFGADFIMEFSTPKSDTLFLSAAHYPTGDKFTFGYLDASSTPMTFVTLAAAKGVLDTSKNEVRISVPIAVVNAAGHGVVKAGGKIFGLQATSERFVGQGAVDRPAGLPSAVPFLHGLLSQIDIATDGPAKYVAGAPSCLKPDA